MDNDDTAETSPFVGISDVIKIVSDLGNHIPDKSWMLYLLDLFNTQDIAVELNLICSFNDDGKFHAILDGVNRYEFKIKPILGHSYLRQITTDPSNNRIGYQLIDEITGQTDSFFFDVESSSFEFSISKHFTGLEWHNKIGNAPYQIRYQVEISNLAFGVRDDLTDMQSIVFFPYTKLLPDNEGIVKQYPVSFRDFESRNGFIRYTIDSGNHSMGIVKKFF